MDRSKHFTLFALPDRPVHSDTNSASPGIILARQQLRAKTKSLTFPPLSIARYTFIQLRQQGHQWRERKCPIFETVAKGDSNPGSLECESGVLPLSYRAPQMKHHHCCIHTVLLASTSDLFNTIYLCMFTSETLILVRYKHKIIIYSSSGYIFWSLFQGIGPMIWFYPLNELEISGYETFVVALFSPILAGIPAVRRALSNRWVIAVLRLLTLASVASFQMSTTLHRLIALAFGCFSVMLVLTASLWSGSQYQRYDIAVMCQNVILVILCPANLQLHPELLLLSQFKIHIFMLSFYFGMNKFYNNYIVF